MRLICLIEINFHLNLNVRVQDFPALQKVVVERPVFPKAVIQNRNQSILILASAERRVHAKQDVERQVFERGKCPGSGHSPRLVLELSLIHISEPTRH